MRTVPIRRSIYPRLAFNASPTIHSVFMRPIYRRSDARYIYRLQADTRSPQRYLGAPNIAVIDGQNTIIFVGVPLHLLNNTTLGNPPGLSAFFEKALTQFSPTQRVNRFGYSRLKGSRMRAPVTGKQGWPERTLPPRIRSGSRRGRCTVSPP